MTTSARPSASEYRALRHLLVSDNDVGGEEFRRALGQLTDDWLAAVYAAALTDCNIATDDIALVALGGSGRGELCPGSDLDLGIFHRRRLDEAGEIAQAVWYPVWDTGVKLGHTVRSIDEAVAMVGDDVESATAMLDARLIAGDSRVVDDLVAQVRVAWVNNLGVSIEALRSDATSRRDTWGDVAFSVEPNVKLAAGGLRDAQIAHWIESAVDVLDEDDRLLLAQANGFLLDVRVALQRCAPGSGEILRLEDQQPVAEHLGIGDADALMTSVAGAARNVRWVLDEAWVRAGALISSGRWRRRNQAVNLPKVDDADALEASDPTAVLVWAASCAREGSRPSRAALAKIAHTMGTPAEPWDSTSSAALVDLFRVGHDAIDVIESLDQVGVWERFVPEWPVVRTRAQRNPYHRFTVDRHLLETVAIAATLTDRVEQPDLLLLGALLHDLGKGRGGDHAEIGVSLAATFGARIGLSSDDVTTLQTLVRHHLLLPEVATRRDIGDGATIESVARIVETVDVLDLLAALTEADARATGPTAWTDWKVGLFTTLVDRVRAYLHGSVSDQYGPMFPSVDQLLLLRAGTITVQGEGRTLTVVAPDKPRLFCRVAGALVLAGLNVVSAAVTSSDGMALEEFTVAPAFANESMADSIEIDWDKVAGEVTRAMNGKVAIAARVAERADTYRRRLRSADDEVRIRFDDTSPDATIVEIDAPDAVGLLFGITQAFADLDVDVRFARVETQADRVVDAFSIVDSDGGVISDESYRSEIERAIRFAVSG